MDVIQIGTEANRIRASSLPGLMRCPWQWVMEQLKMTENESGQAADTGSAVHRAAKSFHDLATKGDVAAAIRAMRASLNDYPFADLEAAGEQFFLYAKDPRNINAVVSLNETEVNLTLPPHETDKTQASIVIRGHVDQVRRMNGRLAVVDIKTGSPEGDMMLHHAAYQLAAYQLAAGVLLGQRIEHAFILRTKDYLKKKCGPVFWQAPWKLSDADRMMLAVRRMVARIRNGEIDPIAGDHCRYCELGSIANCVPKLIQLGY